MNNDKNNNRYITCICISFLFFFLLLLFVFFNQDLLIQLYSLYKMLYCLRHGLRLRICLICQKVRANILVIQECHTILMNYHKWYIYFYDLKQQHVVFFSVLGMWLQLGQWVHTSPIAMIRLISQSMTIQHPVRLLGGMAHRVPWHRIT